MGIFFVWVVAFAAGCAWRARGWTIRTLLAGCALLMALAELLSHAGPY